MKNHAFFHLSSLGMFLVKSPARNPGNPNSFILSQTPENRGADFVVEAVGKPEVWEQAFGLARKGGTVCLFAGCKKGSTFSLDTHRVHYEEVSVTGVFHHTPTHFAKALKYICEKKIRTDLFIKTELTLDQVPDFFAQDTGKNPLKAAIIP